MLSCKEVCALTSESFEKKLPLYKRISIRLHLFICEGCRNMIKQMKLIHRFAGNLDSADSRETDGGETLSEEARNSILDNVEKRNHGSGESD